MIYRLDWNRAWQDGNLDHAVLDVIDDDAATNGCRPTFVTAGGRTFLATSDYGDVHPEVRLYDAETLLNARHSSAPGVIVHHFRCGPFNQNMQWDGSTGRLTCVQNVIEGRGWRLDVLDLEKAIAAGDAAAPGGGAYSHVYTPRRARGLLAARPPAVARCRRSPPGQPPGRCDSTRAAAVLTPRHSLTQAHRFTNFSRRQQCRPQNTRIVAQGSPLDADLAVRVGERLRSRRGTHQLEIRIAKRFGHAAADDHNLWSQRVDKLPSPIPRKCAAR